MNVGENDEADASQKPFIPRKTKKYRPPPDGGYGWVVTFASFMCHFIADGISFTFGVIYPDLLNAFGSSKSATSLICSLFVGMPLLCAPVASLCVERYGCRTTALGGALIASVGMCLSSFANSIQMLTFTYGIMSGFGFAFIYVPASVIPSFWFEKRRALATGVAVAGSGLGTFAMAPLIEFLLVEYGWRNTLLIISGITLNILVFAGLFRDFPNTSVAPEVTFDFDKKQQIVESSNSKDDGNLQKVNSDRSFQSCSGLEDSKNLNVDEREITPVRSIRSSSMYKHQPTKNAHTVGERESLCDNSCEKESNIPGNSVGPINATTKQISSVFPLGHVMVRSSRNLFLLISQQNLPGRDLSNNMQGKSVSCPELSVASEDDDVNKDPDVRQHTDTKRTCKFFETIRKLAKELCEVRLLTVPVYLIFFISSFLLSCTYDLPYIYLPDYAASLSIEKPSFLISIIGIVNTFGQILFGYLGDLKCINILTLYGFSIFISGVFVAIIPVAKSYAGLATFGAVFGLFISASFSLETVVLIKILSLDQLTKSYGLLMFGQGVASLVGPPIGGLLWDISEEYVYTFIFSGASLAFSGVLTAAIVCVGKKHRSRSISESTDISSTLE